MPVSRRSARKRKARRLPPPPPVPAKRSPSGWRRALGWPLVAIGGVLFFMGQIGGRTGIVLLPFDRHHLFEQFGGALIAIFGLIRATSQPS
ncbi:MAG: hypothetical protein ACRDGP_01075 [Actinomycetota bacterium]